MLKNDIDTNRRRNSSRSAGGHVGEVSGRYSRRVIVMVNRDHFGPEDI
jgi:hypothetical protein